VKGSKVLVQLFSWLIPGKPGDAVWFTKAFLRSDKCRLYTDENVWRSAGDAESRAPGWLGKKAPAVPAAATAEGPV
jgi:hypothetical protein